MTGFAHAIHDHETRRVWRRELRHLFKRRGGLGLGRRLGWLLLLPFRLVFWIVGTIIGLVGRLIGLILGFVFLVVGVLVSLTIVGAIIGVPLALFGLVLMFKSIF